MAVSHLAALHFYFRRGSLNGGFAAAVSSEIDAAAVLKSTQHGVKVYLFTTVALLLPANRKSQIADFHHEFHVIYHGSSGEGSGSVISEFLLFTEINKKIGYAYM